MDHLQHHDHDGDELLLLCQYYPDEVWVKVFKFLDPPALSYCSEVCSQWRSIVVCRGLLHPLFIPKILGKVFDLLPFQSLLSARLVCKRWNGTLDKLILQQGWSSPGFTLSTKIDMPEVLDARYQSTDSPSRNIFPTRHLVVWFQCSGSLSSCTRNYRNIHKLLKLYGRQLKYLTIGVPQGPHSHQPSLLFLNNALRHVPNLSGLAVASLKDVKPDLYCTLLKKKERQRGGAGKCNCDDDPNNSAADDFVEIANRFKVEEQAAVVDLLPQLKALSVDSVPPEVVNEILQNSPSCGFIDIKLDYDNKREGLLPTIFEPRLSQIIHKRITSLTLTLNWIDFCRVEKSLTAANLDLKRLSISIYLYHREEFKRAKVAFENRSPILAVLHKLLKAYGKSLQILDIGFVERRFVSQGGWFVDRELQTEFPSAAFLPNVERLRLAGFFGDTTHFLQEMPSLRRYSGGKYCPLRCHDDEEELIRKGFGFYLAQGFPLQGPLLKTRTHFFAVMEEEPVVRWGKNICVNKDKRMEWDLEPI